MSVQLTDADTTREWMKRERKLRGWSTTQLADYARAIARREGSEMALTQQSVSGFEQPSKGKRVPEWMRFVRMAFEEGAPRQYEDTTPRDELAYVRQVDIRYAMGEGASIEDYPSNELVPFNLGFLHSLTHAPLEKIFIATGHGDSMEPTLLKHDLILVDTTQTDGRFGDLIWAFEYAGSGYIKRLASVMVDGRRQIVMSSDNSLVPPRYADPEDIHIVGKVVWIGRRM